MNIVERMPSKSLTRGELYELVWTEPIALLAPRFGISGVALKKACIRAQVPVPPRGYWAKLKAGKRAARGALAERLPGMPDDVDVGLGRHPQRATQSEEEVLREVFPDVPTFAETLDSVRERAARLTGRAATPTSLARAHPAIARLLKDDDRRRAKQEASPFNLPCVGSGNSAPQIPETLAPGTADTSDAKFSFFSR